MSVSLRPLPFLVPSLVAVTASMAAVQDANGTIRPSAATLAAKSGTTFTVTLENGILFGTPPERLGTPKQYLVHRSGTTFGQGGDASVTVTLVVDTNGEVTGFVARSNGSERTLRRIR